MAFMKLHTKYERLGPSSYSQEVLVSGKIFRSYAYAKKNSPFHKKDQGQLKVKIFPNFI